MARGQGPNVEGEISLETKDLNKAIEQIKKLEKAMYQSSNRITQATENVAKSVGKVSGKLNTQTASASKASDASRKLSDSNRRVEGSTKTVSSSITSNINAVNKAEISYQRLAARIRSSALSADQQEKELNESKAALDAASNAINRYGSRSAAAAKSVADFRKRTTAASIAVTNANRSFRGQEIANFRTKMQNLTSSVQLALGPLSGIASRIQAFTALLNKNTAAIASLVGSLVLLSVTFSRSIKASIEAETTFLRTESVISDLGATATVTADEIMAMGTSIAMSTLTSTKAARDAAVALAGFSGIASDSFERIIITAQGMSEAVGGDLVSNTKVLARALQDPERRLTTLERKVGVFNATTEEQIDKLLRAGDIQGAQSQILDDLSGKYDLATAAAGGLAGSLDTTSELTTALFEKLGLASGATEEAANQVNRFNQTIRDFINSDAADAIGRAFVNAIRLAGNAINFLAENASTLALIFNAVLGGTVVKLTGLFVRMLVPLGAAAKGLLTMGAAAKGLAAGTTTLVTLFSSFNPLLRGLKLAALVLTPAIGAVISNFVSSGEKAKEALPEIDDYTSSLDRLIKTANQLGEIDPTLAGQASQLDRNRQELDALAQSYRTLQNRIDEAENRGILETIDDVAASLRITRDDVMKYSDEIVANLNGTFDSSNYPADVVDIIDDITLGFINLSKNSDPQNVVNYLNSFNLAQEVKQRIDELKDSTDELNITVSKGVDENRGILEAHERLSGAVRNLISDYDKESEKLKEVAGSLRTAQEALNFYTQAGAGYDESGEKAEALRRIIANLREEQADLAGINVKITSSYTSLADEIRNTRNETINLRNALRGYEDVTALQDLDAAARSASRSVAELNDKEIMKLSDNLSMSKGIGESMVQFRSRVEEAYVEFVRGNLEAQQSTQKMIDAQARLREGLAQTPSTIQDIRAEYQGLMQDAMTVGAGRHTIKALQERFQAEKDELNRQSEEITELSTHNSLEQLENERVARMEKLQEMWGAETEEYKKHLKELNAEAEKQKPFASIAEAGSVASKALGGVMDVMKAQNREQTKTYQHLAKAQVAISSAMAIAKAISAAPDPLAALPQAALIGAKMGAQMAAIDNAYAQGGQVSGKGSSTSDSIPAMLSHGEFVINAQAARKIGLGNLEALNEGKIPELNTGGGVMPVPVASGNQSGGDAKVNIEIIDQRTGDTAPISAEESISPEGIRNIKILVRDTVKETMSEGGIDRSMAQNYGVSRRPKKR